MFFDKDLLENSMKMDALYQSLGANAPKKRLLHMDYKENGTDKNISVAVYQNSGMSDETIVSELIKTYAAQGRTVGCVGEVDGSGFPSAILYVAPWYVDECREELGVIKIDGEVSQKGRLSNER